jgi:hypothetical protein
VSTTVRFATQRLLDGTARTKRDEAEWHERMRSQFPGLRADVTPVAQLAEWIRADLQQRYRAQYRADVVPFRKREEPPRRPLPPAQPARPQPYRPAASLRRIIFGDAEPLRPAATSNGEALLAKLDSFNLNTDPALKEVVEMLDGGKICARDLLTLAAPPPAPLPSPFYRRSGR